jgi:ribosomal protein S18 acetylase RimI-like enzyme
MIFGEVDSGDTFNRLSLTTRSLWSLKLLERQECQTLSEISAEYKRRKTYEVEYIGGLAMKIELATEKDYKYIVERDRHIPETLVRTKIKEKEIFILKDSEKEIGWMRYGYFWDNIPFMNMIWIDEEYRGQGIGKKIVLYWEEIMCQRGFKLVMTSTQSNEVAQHFYRKIGYRDAGCLLLETQPLEVILTKNL